MALGKELLYIIRARDDASKEIRKVKRSFDDANGSAQASGKTMGLLSGFLTRELGKDMQSFGNSILSAFGTFTEAGAEAIRETKALDAVLRSTKGAAGLTAGEVQNLAKSLQQVTNFQDETILRGQNLLLTFTKIGKETFPQATESMLNIATAMNTDVKTAALQLGKALQDPIEGLDALSRIGVRFTDEQKLMIEAMVRAGDTAGAQKLILQQLEIQFGGLARATSDSRTQMTNAINDVKEEIGKTLIPAFDRAAQSLLPLLKNVGEWVSKNPELVQTIGVVVVSVGGLLTVLGGLVVVLGTVSAALGVLGLTLAAGGAIAVGIGGIVALIVVLVQHWEGLKWMVSEAVDAMKGKVTEFVVTVAEQFGIAEAAVNRFLSLAKQAAKQSLLSAAASAVIPGAGAAIRPRAGGGRVSEGMTLVGEQGPELVSLPRGSFVHTARETRGMMQSSGNVTVQGPLVGEVHVHGEADENRLARKIQDSLTRLIQLQRLSAA